MKGVAYLIYLKILTFKIELGSELINKASYIANKEFQYRQITCIVWEHTQSRNVDAFLENYRGTIATLQTGLSKATKLIKFHKIIKYKQTVLFAAKPEDFKFFLNMINGHIVATIKVILIITKPINNDTELSEFTKLAWENDVGFIVILSYSGINHQATVTSYIPFSEGKCNNYNPVKIADNKSTYFERNYGNFQQCPVKFTALQFPPFFILEKNNGNITHVGGIDGEVIKLLLERLNASMKIVSFTDRGDIGKFINGTPLGSFRDIVDGKADTMVLANILNIDRYKVAQFTYVYTTLDVMWCAPNRREISAWVKVLLPFFTTITPFLVLSFITVIISIMLLQHFGVRESNNKSTFLKVVYQSLGLFFGQSIEYITYYWLSNSVFTLWIWFCLVVRVVYQSNLVEGFQRIILEPHLSTVEEAVKAVDGYGGVMGFLEFYRNTTIEKKYQVLELDELPDYIRQIAKGRRFLLTIDALLVKYLNQTVQFLDERVTRIPVCFFTRPRWPAAEEYNKVIVRIAEGGFVAKIIRDHVSLWLSHSNVTSVESVKAIDFLTLSACFYGLTVMYLVCIIFFCTEIMYFKYKGIGSTP